jgi:hypothetical protein
MLKEFTNIKEIKKDHNTKLIEKYFGITIEEFVTFLVDGKHTYNRDEAKAVKEKLIKMKKIGEIENWNFMWVDAKVYKVMTKNYDEYEKGHHDLGTPEILNLFGFKKVGESDKYKNYDPKRFNQKWSRDKLEVFSDGRTMLSKKNQYIFYLAKDSESSLGYYMEIPKELSYLKEQTKHEAWRLLSKYQQLERLFYVFGYDASYYFLSGFVIDCFYKNYSNDLETFGDKIAELINVKRNLYPMSSSFHPFELYTTPQCGEYEIHQILLEQFVKINKGYARERED